MEGRYRIGRGVGMGMSGEVQISIIATPRILAAVATAMQLDEDERRAEMELAYKEVPQPVQPPVR